MDTLAVTLINRSVCPVPGPCAVQRCARNTRRAAIARAARDTYAHERVRSICQLRGHRRRERERGWSERFLTSRLGKRIISSVRQRDPADRKLRETNEQQPIFLGHLIILFMVNQRERERTVDLDQVCLMSNCSQVTLGRLLLTHSQPC